MSAFSIFAAADEAPHALAWVDEEGELSFAALADLVRPLSRALLELDPRTILSLTATAERRTLVRLLAAIEAGLPVALLHPRWTEHERRRAIEVSGATAPLEGVAPRRGPLGRRVIDPERPLALVFTSGTTGAPRAALLSRRALLAAVQASEEVHPWLDDERWLLCLPLAHVGGLSIVLRCLAARRPVVLARPDAIREVAQRHRASRLSVVPTLLERLLEGPTVPSRLVLVGGAACPEPLRRRALAAGWPVRTSYGMTETCAQIATQRTEHDRGVGPLLPGVEVALDGERILVRSRSLLSGFANEPPVLDAQGFYDTGDFGRLDGGHLTMLGRRTDRIVTGGENVHPLEVERVLESLAGVQSACVFGAPDPRWGQGVTAALVASERPSLAELQAHLDAYLARYKHPRRVVWLDRLIMGPSGKLDRGATARLASLSEGESLARSGPNGSGQQRHRSV
jgi:O-succinylbenzoic acid--CoA ligase